MVAGYDAQDGSPVSGLHLALITSDQFVGCGKTATQSEKRILEVKLPPLASIH
jgi:hypothetical protein